MKSLLVLILLIGGGLSYAEESENKVLQIVSGEYPPWASKDSKKGGFANHIISEVFSREGYFVEYTYLPWARTYSEAKKGSYDATSLWYPSKEREKLFYYSNSIGKEDVVFFHLKTTNFDQWESFEDLKKYRIGATRGYTYTAEFWDAEKDKKLNIIVNNSDEINFNMLLRGRVDLFLSSAVSGYAILYKNFSLEQVQVVTYNYKPLFSNTNHLLFPRKKMNSKKILKLFNEGLQALIDEGAYNNYYDMLLKGYYSK
ncbi:substrate-binding periplasmic protein [Zooshikella harenae]|uniref:Transporter substrate-binding domain-containing protein n=1 Tax=Zooshikella harenae TaxID=2827238 RepID=A0ABS5ZHI4_9GAMM|nr:transporter substrate-binding domain-containing protein [Zooshikella harenae]MBU2713444.1 transporter substrate-binding domain-containing protein [Zooshikella harenae]